MRGISAGSISRLSRTIVLGLVVVAPLLARAQGTAADYARSEQLNQRLMGLAVGIAERPVWIDSTHKFWYRVSVKGGNQFVLVNADTKAKGPAFDHAKLAASLSSTAGGQYTAVTLPFTSFTFDHTRAIKFVLNGNNWECVLADYKCTNVGRDSTGAAGGRGGRGRGNVPDATDPPDARDAQFDIFGEPVPYEGPWDTDAMLQQVPADTTPFTGCRRTGTGGGALGGRGGAGAASDTTPCISKDSTQAAYIQNYNIFIRPVARGGGRGAGGAGAGGRGGRGGGGRGAGGGAPAAAGWQLSWDGSEGSPYTRASLRWSHNGAKLAAMRVTPGYNRMVRYVLSSPVEQLQPSYAELFYRKPGDVVDFREPAVFDIASKKGIKVEQSQFPNAFNLGQISWHEDSRGFTFEYNQRGHQVYRVIEVDANTGAARTLIDEQSRTFIDYSAASDGLGSGGRRLRRDLSNGKEIIWLSERDGWSHLYLYDGLTGRVKNQITKGNWRVQNVQRVDTLARQVYFTATAINPSQDPYFTHYYRSNFDGTGLVTYTKDDGMHTLTWSADNQYYVDSWTRVDLAPVSVLKRASDQTTLVELEKGDITALTATGWTVPEVFVSKARDGTTDIWGIIIKPSNFDPSKKYPVIEQIYAGPQGSFVPKSFAATGATRTLAELGFVVVQVDGMGTTNRSRAFHDVAWKNLGDAGFPDRILWHKAIAAKYPWYDISRVGIYGTSAGGQNALGGLLFHPEFYKVAFSAAGCHDNRMDKIWWNEQWMGWPLGPEYAASSNVDNAAKLQGKLLLVVGEYDTNVDPASTMQVVDALIKSNKEFDLLVIPGAGHTNGGPYGVRKMTDFFVHNLLGVEPPVRNATSGPAAPAPAGRGNR